MRSAGNEMKSLRKTKKGKEYESREARAITTVEFELTTRFKVMAITLAPKGKKGAAVTLERSDDGKLTVGKMDDWGEPGRFSDLREGDSVVAVGDAAGAPEQTVDELMRQLITLQLPAKVHFSSAECGVVTPPTTPEMGIHSVTSDGDACDDSLASTRTERTGWSEPPRRRSLENVDAADAADHGTDSGSTRSTCDGLFLRGGSSPGKLDVEQSGSAPVSCCRGTEGDSTGGKDGSRLRPSSQLAREAAAAAAGSPPPAAAFMTRAAGAMENTGKNASPATPAARAIASTAISADKARSGATATTRTRTKTKARPTPLNGDNATARIPRAQRRWHGRKGPRTASLRTPTSGELMRSMCRIRNRCVEEKVRRVRQARLSEDARLRRKQEEDTRALEMRLEQHREAQAAQVEAASRQRVERTECVLQQARVLRARLDRRAREASAAHQRRLEGIESKKAQARGELMAKLRRQDQKREGVREKFLVITFSEINNAMDALDAPHEMLQRALEDGDAMLQTRARRAILKHAARHRVEDRTCCRGPAIPRLKQNFTALKSRKVLHRLRANDPRARANDHDTPSP